MLVLRTLTVKMTVNFCGTAFACLQINGLEGSLIIEWERFGVLQSLSDRAGYRRCIAAALLAAFCLVTAAVFHAQFSDEIQLIMFLENFAMASAFMLLASVGPGRLSLDARNAA